MTEQKKVNKTTIRIEDSEIDLEVFDAVTSISESRSARVTKHPVETGANISDHVFTDNLTITLSAVTSNADLNPRRTITSAGSSVSNQGISDAIIKNISIVDIDEARLGGRTLLNSLIREARSKIPDNVLTRSFLQQEKIKPKDIILSSKISNVEGVKNLLKRVFNERKTLTISNEDLTEANLIITKLNFPKTKAEREVLNIEMTLEQIIKVNSSFKILTGVEVAEAIKEEAANETIGGTVNTKPKETDEDLFDELGNFLYGNNVGK